MISMDYRYGIRHAADLDWCGHGKRTPRDHPYSYDAHYIWRDFDKHNMPKGVDGSYSDRMQMWDSEMYDKARTESGGGWIESISRKQAEKFVEVYYEGTRKCVGFAKACNVSNGYGLGVFFTVAKGVTNDK